jgi:hypothetical protein
MKRAVGCVLAIIDRLSTAGYAVGAPGMKLSLYPTEENAFVRNRQSCAKRIVPCEKLIIKACWI